jgi:hypothetical protein
MTSDFDTVFGDDSLPQAMVVLGESLAYTPNGGALVNRTMIFSETSTGIEFFDDGQGERATATATVYNDASTGVATPAMGDAITKNSEKWYVTGITTSATAHKLQLARFDENEHSHAGHRIMR